MTEPQKQELKIEETELLKKLSELYSLNEIAYIANNINGYKLKEPVDNSIDGSQLLSELLLNYPLISKPRKHFIMKTYLELGKVCYERKKYKKAINIFLRVKDYAKKGKDLEILASTLLYLGHVYKTIGSLYRARLAYKDALRMFKQLKNAQDTAETSASLAALEILQGRTTHAREHLALARQYYEAEGKLKAIQKIDDLFEAANYVDGAQVVQGRSNGVLA